MLLNEKKHSFMYLPKNVKSHKSGIKVTDTTKTITFTWNEDTLMWDCDNLPGVSITDKRMREIISEINQEINNSKS